jgi:uncharacterized YccA/Bax inhibitor family protein
MESRNPVFNRTPEFSRGGYATFDTRTPSPADLQDMYGAPSATPLQTGRMTIDDVVMRTGVVFGLLVAAAAATFALVDLVPAPMLLGTMLVGFVLAMVISFRRKISPPLILTYAVVEGVFVGGLSKYYEVAFSGIVAQAVLGTLAAFTAMLVLYRMRVVRATPRFTRMLMIAGVGYLVFSMVHLLGVLLNWWDSIYWGDGGPNGLGLLLSALGVVLASLFLVLDFDFVERGIRNGVPQQYAWMAAFGLVVTLVWLYLEMLRLLAILRR